MEPSSRPATPRSARMWRNAGKNHRWADGGEFASSEGVETIEIGDVTAVRKGRSIGLASAVGLKLGFGAGLARRDPEGPGDPKLAFFIRIRGINQVKYVMGETLNPS